ncbi:MAG TPA: NUDIX domain-containing protein [Pseudonocardiaceae bacterium]|nr:NUDIX domain-containing protein [Pseudonocardiaceae bacterium]
MDGRDHPGVKIAALQAHRSQLEIRDALRRFPRRGIRRWGSRRSGSLRAAVVITVVTGGSSPAVLLTQHVAVLREYTGQYVLPGGRINPRESAPDAGRRALAAEIGMRLPPESVLGLLDDYETRAGSVITPVVAWAGEYSALLHSSPEASPEAQVFAVPFPDLDVEPVFVASSEPDRPVIRLPLHGEWLHAPTAAVLYQFREVVLRSRRTRVTHLQEGASAPCEC